MSEFIFLDCHRLKAVGRQIVVLVFVRYQRNNLHILVKIYNYLIFID
ncbi:hypothetical protein KKH3_42810 [Pectobacterium actinidiae]|nr:hypothetical protein KKH3_42810 [Pectobacterium actinidiae]